MGIAPSGGLVYDSPGVSITLLKMKRGYDVGQGNSVGGAGYSGFPGA